ncbi:hypothetical protein J6590_066329 [Homalodisca vitripennis]|nr:hypothetical protein J6590_066329 [Homalodisca vitripennis]
MQGVGHGLFITVRVNSPVTYRGLALKQTRGVSHALQLRYSGDENYISPWTVVEEVQGVGHAITIRVNSPVTYRGLALKQTRGVSHALQLCYSGDENYISPWTVAEEVQGVGHVITVRVNSPVTYRGLALKQT